MSDEEKKARRENFIKELMVSNEWTEEKAREFATTKSAILNLSLNLQTLPEVIPLLRKFGVVGQSVNTKFVVPQAWLGAFKAECQAALGPAFLDDFAAKPTPGGLQN